MEDKKTAVFGLYQTTSQAEMAVDRLMSAGFSSDDISVLLPDNKSTKDFHVARHTAFSPETNLAIEQAAPIVAMIKTKGRGK